MTIKPPDIDRRRFLYQSLAAGAAAIAIPGVTRSMLFGQAPAIVQSAAALPATPQGVAAGMAGADRAVIWSRADRPARLFVEYDTTDQFTNARRVPGPAALEGSDFTARLVLGGLPRGQRIFYRVLFQDLVDIRRWSTPSIGSFRTPDVAATARDITLVWSADTVGQGWGINPAWGGLKLYDTMSKAEPDLFIHAGDTIYADQPVLSEVKLDDGSIWKNVVTEAKSKAAESVAEFRGAYQYNLIDEHMRRFNSEVSQVVLWDDHEVRDNWYPTRDLSKDEKYQVKSTALLAAHARQAFLEYNPLLVNGDDPERIYRTVDYGPAVEVFALDLRSYRSPNSENRQATLGSDSVLAGTAQLAWLKDRLAASRATWKIIASDLPIGVVVPDAPSNFEAFANGEDAGPSGRELEISSLLTFIKERRIRNTVWVTADIHYCAAHHYHPTRAKFTNFEPFWEFVAGPLNAGTFGPNKMDATFGPEVVFTGIPPGMKPNRPPSEGLQFFGKMRVDRRTRALTVTLHDLSGKALFTQELPAIS